MRRLLESLNTEEQIRVMTALADEALQVRGCIVEVGVYMGGTLKYLNALGVRHSRSVFAYDTFTGIPHADEVDMDPVGQYSAGEDVFDELTKALPGVAIVKGVFPGCANWDVLPRIAFVHLDVDNYRSYKEAIPPLWNRMNIGGVMFFDDFGLPGAQKAIEEYFGKEVIQIRFPNKRSRGYVRKGAEGLPKHIGVEINA